MTLLALPFPMIDPVLVQIGPLAIHWYALAYVAGFLLGWRIIRSFIGSPPLTLTVKQLDDLLVWVIAGVILGGRIGYIVFYQSTYYLEHPAEMLQLWRGGMSFHGGMVGSIAGVWLFCRKHHIPFWPAMDVTALVAPIGFGLGRIANFINGELYGRITDMPWGIVFPHGGDLPRHPSQLYQAGLEGIGLGLLLWWATRAGARNYPRRLSGLFLCGYGIARLIGECFREPDIQLGFLWAGTTMGQWLCVPMLVYGAYLVSLSRRSPAAA